MKENQVLVEKGSVLTAAMLLISLGVQRLHAGDYTLGMLMIALGIFCLMMREHFKFHRWHETSSWRGKVVR